MAKKLEWIYLNILQPKNEPTTGSETGWKTHTVTSPFYRHPLNNTDTPLIWTLSVAPWVPVLIGVTVVYKKWLNIFPYLKRINEKRGLYTYVAIRQTSSICHHNI